MLFPSEFELIADYRHKSQLVNGSDISCFYIEIILKNVLTVAHVLSIDFPGRGGLFVVALVTDLQVGTEIIL